MLEYGDYLFPADVKTFAGLFAEASREHFNRLAAAARARGESEQFINAIIAGAELGENLATSGSELIAAGSALRGEKTSTAEESLDLATLDEMYLMIDQEQDIRQDEADEEGRGTVD